MGETDLVRACLTFLGLHGIMAWRNNTGAYKIGSRFISYGHRGSGDIFAILPDGRFCSIECKVGRNKPSDAQVRWADNVNEAGGMAIVVYSLDELEGAII